MSPFITFLLSLGPFAARYGRSDYFNRHQGNQFIDQILARRSVRSYDSRPLAPELLERLVAAAQSAPTSSMLQTWSVVAITDQSLREQLFMGENRMVMASDQPNYEAVRTASAVLVWLVDFTAMQEILAQPRPDWDPQLYEDLAEGMDLLNYELRAIIDCTIAAQTLCLAAESLGLGTVYLGGLRTIDTSSLLKIPPEAKVLPLFGLCLGYPRSGLNSWGLQGHSNWPRAPVKPRLPQEWVLHRQQWQQRDPQILSDYNQLMTQFYQEMNMPNDWYWRVLTRTRPWPSVRRFRDIWKRSRFRGL